MKTGEMASVAGYDGKRQKKHIEETLIAFPFQYVPMCKILYCYRLLLEAVANGAGILTIHKV